jgi:hypothetical protein
MSSTWKVQRTACGCACIHPIFFPVTIPCSRNSRWSFKRFALGYVKGKMLSDLIPLFAGIILFVGYYFVMGLTVSIPWLILIYLYKLFRWAFYCEPVKGLNE